MIFESLLAAVCFTTAGAGVISLLWGSRRKA